MATPSDRVTTACIDGLCSVLAAHPEWLAELHSIASGFRELAPDVRWARATRVWADLELAEVSQGRAPYPDALAAAVGYASLLKGEDWDAVLDRLGVLAGT